MEASAVTPPAPVTGTSASRSLRELLPADQQVRVGLALGSIALVVASFVAFGSSGRAFVGAVVCPVFLLLAAIDWKHRILPNLIVLPATAAVALIVAASPSYDFFEHLWTGLGLFGFFFIFAVAFRGSFGMGDAKAGLLVGLALGLQGTFSAMMAAFGALFFAAIWVLIRGGLAARKQSLPFGPFLAFGVILGFFFA